MLAELDDVDPSLLDDPTFMREAFEGPQEKANAATALGFDVTEMREFSVGDDSPGSPTYERVDSDTSDSGGG